MIKQLYRSVQGTYYAANNTVAFPSNPFISANSSLTLFFTSNDSKFATSAVSISANNVVTNFNSQQYDGQGVDVHTPCFGGGLTGIQSRFSMTTSTTPTTMLQATLYNSTAMSANVQIQVSADNVGWINYATLSPSSASNTTAYSISQVPWPYAQANILDISPANAILLLTKAN